MIQWRTSQCGVGGSRREASGRVYESDLGRGRDGATGRMGAVMGFAYVFVVVIRQGEGKRDSRGTGIVRE